MKYISDLRNNSSVSVPLQYKSDKNSTEHTEKKTVDKRPVIHHQSVDYDDVSRNDLDVFSFLLRDAVRSVAYVTARYVGH